ncbi:MAG: hypothetical protein ACT4NL_17275 [Pseudomarimonas sp.]
MTHHDFAVCVDNHGYEASLELRKLYEVLPDADAEKHAQLRVIDESGEDYLYPAKSFDQIALPANTAQRVFRAHAQQRTSADVPASASLRQKRG